MHIHDIQNEIKKNAEVVSWKTKQRQLFLFPQILLMKTKDALTHWSLVMHIYALVNGLSPEWHQTII